jgi:hypothetical protein
MKISTEINTIFLGFKTWDEFFFLILVYCLHVGLLFTCIHTGQTREDLG